MFQNKMSRPFFRTVQDALSTNWGHPAWGHVWGWGKSHEYGEEGHGSYAQLFQKGHLSFGISSKEVVYKMPQCLMAGRVLQCICLQSLSFTIPNESNGLLNMVFHASDPPHSCAQRSQGSMHVLAFPLRSLQQSLQCSRFSIMHILVSVATNL